MEEVKLNWKQDDMLEIVLKEADDFLKVRETLSRIGVKVEKTENYINLVTSYINKVNTIWFILKNFLLLMVKKPT